MTVTPNTEYVIYKPISARFDVGYISIRHFERNVLKQKTRDQGVDYLEIDNSTATRCQAFSWLNSNETVGTFNVQFRQTTVACPTE